MVKQTKSPKLSSSAKKLFRTLEASKPGTFDALKTALGSNLVDLTAVTEHRLFHRRKRLLVELANMRDDGLVRFRQKVASPFRHETDAFLFDVRDVLRRAWLRSTPLREKQDLADAMLVYSFAKPGAVRFSLAVGRVLLDPENLPAQLAAAIGENWQRFRVCGNRDCPARFFIAKRKTQKICERGGECTAYAQRIRSLEWWRREGNKWRRAKSKQRKSKGRRLRRAGGKGIAFAAR